VANELLAKPLIITSQFAGRLCRDCLHAGVGGSPGLVIFASSRRWGNDAYFTPPSSEYLMKPQAWASYDFSRCRLAILQHPGSLPGQTIADPAAALCYWSCDGLQTRSPLFTTGANNRDASSRYILPSSKVKPWMRFFGIGRNFRWTDFGLLLVAKVLVGRRSPDPAVNCAVNSWLRWSWMVF